MKVRDGSDVNTVAKGSPSPGGSRYRALLWVSGQILLPLANMARVARKGVHAGRPATPVSLVDTLLRFFLGSLTLSA